MDLTNLRHVANLNYVYISILFGNLQRIVT